MIEYILELVKTPFIQIKRGTHPNKLMKIYLQIDTGRKYFSNNQDKETLF